MASFDSEGVAIDYEVRGEGRPILLVHGFAADRRRNWTEPGWLDALVEWGHRVVALDCRGHGGSAKPHDPEAYAEGAMRDDALRLLDHLGIERADLMGYSMGGMISLDLVLHRADRLHRVVLAGIGDGVLQAGPVRDTEGIARALTARDAATLRDPVARAFRAFAEAGGNDLHALAACMRRRRTPPDPTRLAGIANPVLVVIGSGDDLAGGAERLAGAIPGARLEVVPGDHLTAVGSHRYKEVVRAFLEAP